MKSNRKQLSPLRGGKKKGAPVAPSMSFSMLDELQEQLQDYEQDLKTSSANGNAVRTPLARSPGFRSCATFLVCAQFGGGFTSMPPGMGDEPPAESEAGGTVVEATAKFKDPPVVRSRVKESKSAPAIRRPQDAVAARKA